LKTREYAWCEWKNERAEKGSREPEMVRKKASQPWTGEPPRYSERDDSTAEAQHEELGSVVTKVVVLGVPVVRRSVARYTRGGRVAAAGKDGRDAATQTEDVG